MYTCTFTVMCPKHWLSSLLSLPHKLFTCIAYREMCFMIYRVHYACVFIPLDLGVPGLSVVCVLAGLPPLRIVVWRSKYMYMCSASGIYCIFTVSVPLFPSFLFLQEFVVYVPYYNKYQDNAAELAFLQILSSIVVLNTLVPISLYVRSGIRDMYTCTCTCIHVYVYILYMYIVYVQSMYMYMLGFYM